MGILVLDQGLVEDFFEADHSACLGFAFLSVVVCDSVFGIWSFFVAVAGKVEDPVDLFEVEFEGGHGRYLWFGVYEGDDASVDGVKELVLEYRVF